PEHTGEQWNFLQQARWIAEDAVRRFSNSDTAVNPTIRGQALIWAGYSNRVLGELFCEVVFDGGPALPPEEASRRAEQHFTEALQLPLTSAQRNAALAGRAQ